ncbi:glycosyltransferase family 2 protein [Flammeovirga aprica]|uniref:Glycosyltransferase family 2 protein n=1 Tax=Flammeovirga aprica JL-4 TaxID=694437 RepID=A0A7X9P2V6_9BACT|nr:glycosyltransferase family A protein [Flammeovirga aprica]NME68173.1 glycosyltransferase family 2 protein [Flammeovirga aprica JL-4]
MKKNKCISIIIPSFNRANLISETLDSVLYQTYSNWECIIIDDGSTDGTQKIIQEYVKRDSRFKLYQRDREPKGAPTCRNIGLEKSSGDYIMFFDSDDILSLTCFEDRIKYFNEQKECDAIIFSGSSFTKSINDGEEITEIGIDINSSEYLKYYLSEKVRWLTPSPIWKKKFIEHHLWDESITNWQDPEYHIRILNIGLKFKVVDKIDWYYRIDSEIESISKKRFNMEYLLNRRNTCEKIISYLKGIEKEIFQKKQSNFFLKEAEKLALESNCDFKDIKLLSNALSYYSNTKHKVILKYLFTLHLLKLFKVPFLRGLLYKIRITFTDES